MAKQAKFEPTNTTANTITIAPIKLQLTSNYSRKEEVAKSGCLLDNLTCTPKTEMYHFSSKDIPTVNTNYGLLVQNPSKVKSGVMYKLQSEHVLVITDSAVPDFEVDEPIVFETSVRHKLNEFLTEEKIREAFIRHISGFFKEDGTSRFGDLMRSQDTPTVD